MSAAELPQIRLHGDAAAPTLVYLPGLHGDWTLLTRFRRAIAGHVRLVEIAYPRWTAGSLDQHARAVEAVLVAQGVNHGWLLAESFGSQIAWSLLATEKPGFRCDGLILAGGFVRHPWRWAVRLALGFHRCVPGGLFRFVLRVYGRLVERRQSNDAECRAAWAEFVARRTDVDLAAWRHRLRQIAESDPRPVAAATHTPVYFLAGGLDLVVPWWAVRSWLRRQCPGWLNDRIVAFADHPVLHSIPGQSAAVILEWMQPR